MATITSLTFGITSTYSGAGIRRARRDIQDFDNGLRAMDKAASNIGKQLTSVTNAALAFAPALVPIAVAATGVAGGLAAAGAAAGLAAGIFGGALFGAIKATNGATKSARDALEKQKETLAGLTPGTKAYEEQLKKVNEAKKNLKTIIDGLTPAQQKYVKATSGMKGAWGEFIKTTEKDTLTPVSIVMGALARNFEKFTPLVKAVSPVITRLAKDFAAWMDGPGLDQFIDTMVAQGVPALEKFIKTTQSMLGVLGQGVRDFLPYGNRLFQSMAAGAKSLKSWGEGGGFTRFLDKVHSVAPDVKEFFSALVTALGNIAKAAADLSDDSFSVLTVLLKVLASLPPELLANLVRGFLAWRAALVLYAIAAGAAAVVTTALAVAASPFLLLMAGAALTVLAVVAGVAALGVGIFFLVKYWETVWSAVKSTAMTVWNWLTNGLGQLALVFLGPVGGLILLWQNWNTIWGWIASKVTWIYDKILTPIGHGFQWLYNFLVGNSVIPDLINGIIYWFNFLLAPLRIAIDAVIAITAMAWTGIQATWDIFWATFGPIFTAAWTGLAATASAAWAVLVAAWNFLWTVIVSAYQVGWAILSGSWQIGWAWLTGAAQIAWSTLVGFWRVVWATVTGIWNVFYATFSAVFSGAWNVVVAIAAGVWNVIKAAWQALWAVVTAIFLTFAAVFTGRWGAAWNAIKDAASAIWNVLRTAWQALLNVLLTAFNAFAGVFTAAFRATWAAIQSIATAAWNALRSSFQAFLAALQNLWNTAWTAIRNIFQTILNAIVSIAQSAWNLIRAAVQVFITAVTGIWNTGWTAIRTFFQTAANGISAAAGALWDKLREIFSTGSTWLRNTFWNPVRDFFTKTIPNAFDSAVKAIGKAWDALKKVVMAPVQAIVNVVYNSGIRKLWNVVATKFGASELPEFKLPGFAKGGEVNGPGSGTSDSIVARLSAGEHVWTAKEVAGAGGHEAVAALRRQAMGSANVRALGDPDHRFADGGGVLGTGWGPDSGPDLVPDGIIGDAWNGIKGAVGKLKDLALGAISGPFGAAVDGVAKLGKGAVRKVVPGDGTALENMGVGMIDEMAKTAKAWVSDNDVAPDTGGGGGFIPWAKWKSGDGNKQTYGGVVVNRRTAAMLGHASRLAKTSFSMTQGSYSSGKLSAGTHSGGGAVDLGPAKDSVVGAMRSSGFAAWRRTRAEGFAPHIHGIAVGDPTASAAAKAQVKAFHAGRNGLSNNGPDTYKGGITSGKSVAAAKATGKSLNAGRGWGSHWSALEALWTRESGWRWNADNPSSDAYGIPQALPGSKMKSAGSDWKTNPATQIKWGLGYIKSRYGNPSKANSFQKSNNWYGLGTPGARSGPAIVGEHGPELVGFRGGERVESNTALRDLVGNGGTTTVEVNVPVTVQGDATPGTVDKLQRELVPKLTMAIKQGVGRRP
ncbi:hypothetical protein DMA15_03490 [Streptomyces sp. WAC 01529]|uniref:aggregation-promoting factor C-terminal-like domain-containing protein n=1 Tax=Streptomyces sp. WAC 01529 TaxID=2203205 RepID=UPI000F6CBD2E|nr:hypothetical protein [Streptomyces sp. WAC 01529]AZM51756.1 hypothetical protein DMA15_03490 [Streptomyces sp. WAC 01529]